MMNIFKRNTVTIPMDEYKQMREVSREYDVLVQRMLKFLHSGKIRTSPYVENQPGDIANKTFWILENNNIHIGSIMADTLCYLEDYFYNYEDIQKKYKKLKK